MLAGLAVVLLSVDCLFFDESAFIYDPNYKVRASEDARVTPAAVDLALTFTELGKTDWPAILTRLPRRLSRCAATVLRGAGWEL